eukprot:scaffold35710_cov17-Tisochrysis_lutea.AAC.2
MTRTCNTAGVLMIRAHICVACPRNNNVVLVPQDEKPKLKPLPGAGSPLNIFRVLIPGWLESRCQKALAEEHMHSCAQMYHGSDQVAFCIVKDSCHFSFCSKESTGNSSVCCPGELAPGKEHEFHDENYRWAALLADAHMSKNMMVDGHPNAASALEGYHCWAHCKSVLIELWVYFH